MIYIAQESTNETGCITARETIWVKTYGSHCWQEHKLADDSPKLTTQTCTIILSHH